MAEVEQAAVVARMEHLYREYNKLSHFLRGHHVASEDVDGEIHDTADIVSIDTSKHQVKNLRKQVQDLTSDKSILEKLLQQHKNESIKQIEKLKREVGDLRDDTDVLKDILKRLNEELNRYHIKYGKLPPVETVPSKKEISHSSLYKLSGLLQAYDELLLERDTTIRNNNEKLGDFMVQVDSITAENEKLHARLEKLQSQVPLGTEEAEMVAADARLLLEERELLVEELQQQKQHNKQVDAQQQHQLQALKHKIEEYELQNHSLSYELGTWKTKCMQLEKKCNSLHDQLQGSVPQQEHHMAVKECQRLFEELRKAYKQDSGNMKGKIHAVRSEKQNLAEKLIDTSACLHRLRGQVSGLKGSLRKCESHINHKKSSLKALQVTARLTNTRLKALASICSELLEDREKLLDAVMIYKKEKEQLCKEVTLRSAAVGALSQKLKEEHLVWSGRVAERDGAMKAARAAWKRSARESSHLRSLLATKDNTIASLISDYKLFGLTTNEVRHYHHPIPHQPKL
ncbi:centrosomal protein of 89 kDa-like isoform X2 [Portunus trituberculatus]|nr:centrosomal protein of 89 kDa-like isoform X2 [Portunus trituberculatus]XP_045133110.1 centrosomal protein of 89 kDa-like isoform X2 [Portunus trituberculatus]